jgi:hypothetical protein
MLIAVMFAVFIGLGVFMIRIFRDAGTTTAITISQFVEELKHWKHWLPQISKESISQILTRNRMARHGLDIRHVLCLALFTWSFVVHLRLKECKINMDWQRDTNKLSICYI